MEVLETLGSNVRKLRLARGLTQDALAKRLGVTLQTIHSYESGAKWLRAESFAALAAALGVRPWELLAEESSEPSLDQALAVVARSQGYGLVKL